MATKRGKAKKKNPCWKGYTAMGDDGKIVMKKKGNKMVPACRPIKGGASMSTKRDDDYNKKKKAAELVFKTRLKESGLSLSEFKKTKEGNKLAKDVQSVASQHQGFGG